MKCVKKTKPAIWMQAFPEQIKPGGMARRLHVTAKEQSKNALHRQYAKEAREFVQAAIDRGETCVVVNTIPELKNGTKYGWPISNRLNENHHKRGRRGFLLLDKRHWMAVSKQGHRWIHSHPAEARKHGWICELGKWNMPDVS